MHHFYATVCKVFVNKLADILMRGSLGAPDRSGILMFHDVIADASTPPHDEYACPFGKLAEIISAYRDKGFRFVSLDSLLSTPAKQARYRHVSITFDDGFQSAADLAAPYLAELQIPFTVFVTVDHLDKSGYLSTEQLIALSKNPYCTVGSHFSTHSMSRFLSAKAVRRELTESKTILSKLIGKPIEHLAFPYGSAYACSLRDILLAKACGYRSAALTTQTAYTRFPFHPYTLPRLNMPSAFSR